MVPPFELKPLVDFNVTVLLQINNGSYSKAII